MKIITCAGYYGSGSSAITDLLSECECVYSLGEYEFRFIHDPEGISDLEYNLVENHNRHNSGHALKRYERYVRFLSGNRIISKYEPFFQNQFLEISNWYINELIDFKFIGMWHQDVIDRGKLFYFIERLINKVYMKFGKIFLNKSYKSVTLLNKEITYFSRPKEKFLEVTKEYTNRLFNVANIENKEYIMVDQLLPPSNIYRYLRYFEDIKVIVVDRDPRDIYLLEKLYWKGTIVPYHDIDIFCKWFILTREHINDEPENKNEVLRIQFEDLIYKYESTIDKIFEFLDIDKKMHKNKKKYFNIDVSINNTRLWEKHKNHKREIEQIELQLSKYLYKGF